MPSTPGAGAADHADRLAVGQRHCLPVALPSCSSGEHWTPPPPQSSDFSYFPINLIAVLAEPGLRAAVFTVTGELQPCCAITGAPSPPPIAYSPNRPAAAPSGQPQQATAKLQRAAAGQQQAAAHRECQQETAAGQGRLQEATAGWNMPQTSIFLIAARLNLRNPRWRHPRCRQSLCFTFLCSFIT